jgi:hypothetical protein
MDWIESAFRTNLQKTDGADFLAARAKFSPLSESGARLNILRVAHDKI